MSGEIPIWAFLPVGAIALFSFLAVASWADARRREREAYYKSETLKKIAESQGGEAVLAILREDKVAEHRKQIEGLRLGGMITSVVGVGLMVFLHQAAAGEQAYWVGLIPLLIGAVLLVHSYMVVKQ